MKTLKATLVKRRVAKVGGSKVKQPTPSLEVMKEFHKDKQANYQISLAKYRLICLLLNNVQNILHDR